MEADKPTPIDFKGFKLSMDSNIINPIFRMFESLLEEGSYVSFHEFVDQNPAMEQMKQMLSTDLVGFAIPSIVNDFGSKGLIDFEFHFTPEIIDQKMPKMEKSGIQISKRGNIKFNINFSGLVKVVDAEGVSHVARTIIG